MMENGNGKIFTFYSYKGGVGRTMAVANVGFLAAQSNLRVLVMDWDLEAPGLAYYFRGMLAREESDELKDVPGVLDFLWDWSRNFEKSKSEEDIETLKKAFAIGDIFETCRRPLLPSSLLSGGACLDYIGPGASMIHCDEDRPYADALSRFSWTKFYEKQAGGYVIKNLREWAKRNYDVILIDSRTGLADVAGVCTMQLPDTVALCFILNRQNIEGVARISGAIRASRKDEISLRAVPMRVAQSVTAEESDAWARARSELARIGGFTADQVQSDFSALSVRSAENVSYYETLSPVMAQVARLDPLTANYALLAQTLLGHTIQTPELPLEMLEIIRHRIRPRHATIDYLKSLETADPARVTEELERLLDSALTSETDTPGMLEEEYLTALINAAFAKEVILSDAVTVRTSAVDLARLLFQQRGETYLEAILITSIESYLDQCASYLGIDDEIELLEELESYLIKNTTLGSLLRQIKVKEKLADAFLQLREYDLSLQAVNDLQELCRSLMSDVHKLSPSQVIEVSLAEAEAFYVIGKVLESRGDLVSAYRTLRAGLDRFDVIPLQSKPEATRLGFRLNAELATLPKGVMSPEEASGYAVKAVSYNWSGGVSYFIKLANVILSSHYASDFVSDFISGVFDISGMKVESFHARHINPASEFLQITDLLILALQESKGDRKALLTLKLAQSSAALLRSLSRRRILFRRVKQEQFEALQAARIQLTKTLTAVGLDFDEMLNQYGIEAFDLSDGIPKIKL